METRPSYANQEVQFRGHLLREGFAQVPHSLIRSHALSSNAKLVMLLLLSRAAKDGTSFQGQEGMAEDVGISKRTTITALNELKRVGLITWERHGQGKTNTYFVLQDGLDQFIAEVQKLQLLNGNISNSEVAPVANKEEPVEEEPVEEEPVRDGETRPLNFEEDKTVWPDWYATLYAIPGFKVSLKDAKAWLDRAHISDDIAETTAYSLKGKWPGPTKAPYRDAWAVFQGWAKRPLVNGGPYTNGRGRGQVPPTDSTIWAEVANDPKKW